MFPVVLHVINNDSLVVTHQNIFKLIKGTFLVLLMLQKQTHSKNTFWILNSQPGSFFTEAAPRTGSVTRLHYVNNLYCFVHRPNSMHYLLRRVLVSLSD